MKKIQAWAVFHSEYRDIGDLVFSSKIGAQDYLREHAYDKNPLIMKIALKKYSIISCTISYKLPKKKV